MICDDSPFGGARFTMLFDASQAIAARAADGTGPIGGTVLFVDDEPALREVAGRTLESLGYRALLAANGEAALQLLRSEPRIDLMVLDLVMPGLGGEEVWRAAQATRPELQVLFCTAHSISDELLTRLGPVRVLDKPLVVDTFAQEIRRALRRAPVAAGR